MLTVKQNEELYLKFKTRCEELSEQIIEYETNSNSNKNHNDCCNPIPVTVFSNTNPLSKDLESEKLLSNCIEYQKLKEDYINLVEQNHSLTDNLKEISLLRSENKKTQNELIFYKTLCQDHTKAIETLNIEKGELREKIERLTNDLAYLNENIKLINNNANSVEKEIITHKRSTANHQNKIKLLEKENIGLKDKLAKYSMSLHNLNDKNRTHLDREEYLKKQIKDLINESENIQIIYESRIKQILKDKEKIKEFANSGNKNTNANDNYQYIQQQVNKDGIDNDYLPSIKVRRKIWASEEYDQTSIGSPLPNSLGKFFSPDKERSDSNPYKNNIISLLKISNLDIDENRYENEQRKSKVDIKTINDASNNKTPNFFLDSIKKKSTGEIEAFNVCSRQIDFNSDNNKNISNINTENTCFNLYDNQDYFPLSGPKACLDKKYSKRKKLSQSLRYSLINTKKNSDETSDSEDKLFVNKENKSPNKKNNSIGSGSSTCKNKHKHLLIVSREDVFSLTSPKIIINNSPHSKMNDVKKIEKNITLNTFLTLIKQNIIDFSYFNKQYSIKKENNKNKNLLLIEESESIEIVPKINNHISKNISNNSIKRNVYKNSKKDLYKYIDKLIIISTEENHFSKEIREEKSNKSKGGSKTFIQEEKKLSCMRCIIM